MLGKTASVRLSVTCMLAEGHLLLEDFPGTGKTSLASSIANTVQGAHSRIQFTPDLLPSDVTGVTIFDQRSGAFEFHPGPIFATDRARRRDQPRLAEDPVGAARGHGGAAGHGRRRLAPGRPPVHGHRDAEPDRAGGHVPAARGAARPVPHEDQPRLPRPRRTVTLLARRGDPRPGRRRPHVITASAIAEMSQLADQVHVDPSVLDYVSQLAGVAPAAPCPSGRLVRGGLAFVRAAKTWAAADGRTTSCPTTSRCSPSPSSGTGSCSTPKPSSTASPSTTSSAAPQRGPAADRAGGVARIRRPAGGAAEWAQKQEGQQGQVPPRLRAAVCPRSAAHPARRRGARRRPPLARSAAAGGHHARRARGAARQVAGLAAGLRLGWQELFLVAACCLITLLIAVGFVVGRPCLDISIELDPARVSVGRPRPAGLSRTTGRGHGCAPLSVEVPVGAGPGHLPAAVAGRGANHDELFVVPTDRRAVIPIGPPSAVRTDPLGLLRREAVSRPPSSCSCTRRSSAWTRSAPGLQRDLEGQATRDLSTSDLAFHTLRDYVTGDDWRHVHWRSTAKAGRLLVRQFQDTRRCQLAVVVDGAAGELPHEDEFELAMSVAGLDLRPRRAGPAGRLPGRRQPRGHRRLPAPHPRHPRPGQLADPGQDLSTLAGRATGWPATRPC